MRKNHLTRLKRFLLSLPDNSLAQEQVRKMVMLYLIVLLGIFFLVILGGLAYVEGNISLMVLDLSLGIVFVFLYFYIRISRNPYLGSIVGVLTTLIFFIVLFATGAAHQQTFVWYYLFPLISLFLLGTRAGSFFSLFLIGLTLLIDFLSPWLPFYHSYPSGFMLRLCFSYIAVFLFAYIFERTRTTTQRKLEEALAELEELAVRDSLTGLYNRRYLNEAMARVSRRLQRSGTSAAFLMADLDYFKNYNDTYGHQAGDDVLNNFSRKFASQIRRQTDLVFRYGGEEFAILLSPTNRKTAESLARRIIEETRNLNIPHKGSHFGFLTVSVGVAYFEEYNPRGVLDLIDYADKALYEAKDAGRNRYVMREIVNSGGS